MFSGSFKETCKSESNFLRTKKAGTKLENNQINFSSLIFGFAALRLVTRSMIINLNINIFVSRGISCLHFTVEGN